MGRPGAGGGSHSSHSSSGGHSSSRMSGGHRPSSSRPSTSSSRPGMGSSSFSTSHHSSYAPPRPPMHTPPRPPRPPRNNYGHTTVNNYYGPTNSGYTRSYEEDRSGRFLKSIVTSIIIVVLLLIMLFAISRISGGDGSIRNTTERTKLDSGVGFTNNCIVDKTGWIENKAKVVSALKSFYNETGVQPYIVMLDYDVELRTDSQKEQWANDYYENNIGAENGFLYVYFSEASDDEVGYMVYVNGKQVSSVMDAEAIDIFWNYLDRYWYSDLSMTDVFIKTYTSTANTIMSAPTNGWDFLKTLILVVFFIVIAVIVVIAMIKRHKLKIQKLQEEQRILNTPLQTIQNENDIVNKYT